MHGPWSCSLFGEMLASRNKLLRQCSCASSCHLERSGPAAVWSQAARGRTSPESRLLARWGHDPLIITSQPFGRSSMLNRTTLWAARRTAMPPRGLYRKDSACAVAQLARFSFLSAKGSTLISKIPNRFYTTDVSSRSLRLTFYLACSRGADDDLCANGRHTNPSPCVTVFSQSPYPNSSNSD